MKLEQSESWHQTNLLYRASNTENCNSHMQVKDTINFTYLLSENMILTISIHKLIQSSKLLCMILAKLYYSEMSL